MFAWRSKAGVVTVANLTVYEIGEDSDKWLVLGRHDVHRETISINAARLAVIGLLREQLLPGDSTAFSETVEFVLDLPGHRIEYPIIFDEETERVYYRSPIGKGNRFGKREGTCAVTFGYRLKDHHTEEADRG